MWDGGVSVGTPNRDYQNPMSTDTRSLDTAGEHKAEQTTVDNYGVHQEKVPEVSPSGMEYTTMKGTFGMLANGYIDTAHTAKRAEYFQRLAEHTGTQRNPLGNGPATETAAYRSQKAMAANFTEDLASHLPRAVRDYNLFVPMANMAARSFQKTNEVADWMGFNENSGPDLNLKDRNALAKAGAGTDRQGMLTQSGSLNLAARNMMSARMAIRSATEGITATVESDGMRELNEQLSKATDQKSEIKATIANVQKYVGYIETLGSVVAGGAGFVHNHLSPGKASPTLEADEIDLRSEGVQKTQKGGEHTATGAGYLSKAVAFGVELYHSKELQQLETKIDVISTMLSRHHATQAAAKVTQAKQDLQKAVHDYALAMDAYQAAINDRRMAMAAIGANADKRINRKGDSDISDAMLYTTTIMETQSFLQVAFEAGEQAKATLHSTAAAVNAHRDQYWGILTDAYGPDNTPRKEGRGGPDVSALNRMRLLVDWWFEGATEVKEVVDRVANSQGESVLEMAGYTAEY